jgi:hypothetical protein
MEFDNKEYASKGVGAAALTTGIIGATGTGLSVLGGGLGKILGGGGWNNGGGCFESMPVNHYELNQQKEITNRDMEIAYLKGRDAAKTDSLELYKYVDGRFRGIEAQICQQSVINATLTSNLACLQNQFNVLQGLTKTVIPITSVCPLPATATTTTGG